MKGKPVTYTITVGPLIHSAGTPREVERMERRTRKELHRAVSSYLAVGEKNPVVRVEVQP